MIHTIKNELLAVTVSEYGAELQSILGHDGTEYLWQGNPAYWRGRATNIFPYVARLTRGSYYMDGLLYHMDIHGFSPYRYFQFEGGTARSMAFLLTDDEGTFDQYPRHFAFRVVYTLRRDKLEITYEVENRDEKTMYFGLGGHPGFNVPLAGGRSFEDYRLRFSGPCRPRRVGFTEDCFLNGRDTVYPLLEDRIIPLRHDLFDQDAIVLTGMAREVTLEADGEPHGVTVSFPEMGYLGLWHRPETDAPYICIEPWCSLPSTQDRIAVFEEQKDLIPLEAGGRYSNTWSITLHGQA